MTSAPECIVTDRFVRLAALLRFGELPVGSDSV